MSDARRLFVAVPIPERLREEVDRAVPDLRAVCKDFTWVPPSNYHFTLKFLGETSGDLVPGVERAIAAAAGGVPAFGIRLEGFGAFPNLRRPRVLWIGVSGDTDAFRRLGGRTERLTAELGFPREEREFSPHLTLARSRRPGPMQGLEKAAEGLIAFRTDLFEVRAVHLMESRLLPGGAKYSIVSTFNLQGDST